MLKRPNIFEFTDYRLYLRELYLFLKKTLPAFSHRFFAKQAGFASPNFLKLVMESRRNLTHESIPRFIKALKLNKQEAEYFTHLVNFNQAKDGESKNLSYSNLARSRRYREVKPVEKEQFQFYSKWYHSAIRELVTVKGFRDDPEWMAKQLHPKITAKQAAQSIKLLTKLKLLGRAANGQLVQTDANVSSGAEVRSLAIANFHRQMLAQAAESITSVAATDRDISSVTLGLAPGDIKLLKEKIDQFRKDLLAAIGGGAKPTEQVYQLNLQLFPLTHKVHGDDNAKK